MAKRPLFFIYDRKEISILVALGLVLTLFSFTLGVHLGKKSVQHSPSATHDAHDSHTAAIDTKPDETPSRLELADQGKNAAEHAEVAMDQALQNEVAKTGMRTSKAIPTTLPDEKKVAHAPNKVPVASGKSIAQEGIRYSIQVGSYPSLQEAKSIADSLKNKGLEPQLKAAEIKDKGTWYRIYLGNFESRQMAESLAEQYVKDQLINTFVIQKAPDV